MVLALVKRLEPISGYHIRRNFSGSIVGQIRSSNGTVYPILKRLERGGFVVSETSRSRGAEIYRCSTSGLAAVRRWASSVDDSDLVIEDMVRTKALALGVLTADERVEWFSRLLSQLTAELGRLDKFIAEFGSYPFVDLVHDNAKSTLCSRIAWAQRSLEAVRRGGDI
jgi:DNA-binding PadR family transcriptional regulator